MLFIKHEVHRRRQNFDQMVARTEGVYWKLFY